MKSLSTLIGIMLLTTGLQVGAGDFDPYQEYQPYQPSYQPYQPQLYQSTYQVPPEYQAPPAYQPYQPYQPTYQAHQPYQAPPEYNAYDYAMDLVEKDIKRSGGRPESRAIPEWQAYEIGQRNYCNMIQGNPAAQRTCFDSLP